MVQSVSTNEITLNYISPTNQPYRRIFITFNSFGRKNKRAYAHAPVDQTATKPNYKGVSI